VIASLKRDIRRTRGLERPTGIFPSLNIPVVSLVWTDNDLSMWLRRKATRWTPSVWRSPRAPIGGRNRPDARARRLVGAARTARKTRLCVVFSGMNGRRGRRADREMTAAK
jgi:hypothetical protein